MVNYNIYLFRHGRTVYNVKGLFCGHKHTKLVWRGKRDAKKVANKLKNKRFQIAFHTSLPRSKETLKYVFEIFTQSAKKLLLMIE